MDRIERALELLIDDHVQFREEHKALLTSQVLLTDKVDKLADELKALAQQTDRRIAELAQQTKERFAETDERLHALINVVDGLIRRPPS
jgi:uncharacterized HAD superfamily protein